MAIAPVHVVLLLVVSADPSSAAVSRAAADALAAPFSERPQVVLRTLPTLPPTKDLATLARDAKADATVILSCSGRGCASAEVRVDGAGVDPTARSVRFGERDALGERGRAIGLLASTLLPEGWSRTPVAGDPGPAPAVLAAAVAATGASQPPAPPDRWGVDTTAALLAGTSGGVSDFGLTIAGRRHLPRGWAIRAGLKLELGDLPGNGAHVRAAGGIAGVQWNSPGLERSRELGFGARADLIALGRKVRPDMDLDGDRERTDLALGGDAVGIVGLGLSPHAAVVAAAGIELLGSIAGLAGGDDAVLTPRPPAFRLLVELGVVATF